MTKEQAKERLENLGGNIIMTHDEQGRLVPLKVMELFNLFLTLTKKVKVGCDTCKYQAAHTYECKECKQFSYWEEKEI